MVRSEIRAVEDALGDTFSGYMVWAPSNVYTRQALKEEKPGTVHSITVSKKPVNEGTVPGLRQ